MQYSKDVRRLLDSFIDIKRKQQIEIVYTPWL